MTERKNIKETVMPEKKFFTAIALTKQMAASILGTDELAFLQSFCATNPVEELPEKLTQPFMEKIFIDADACLTCWGTPNLTDELVASSPKLRLIAHAAGSVKSLVPSGYWRSGRRVTSNAPVIAEDVAQTVLAYILFVTRGLWVFAQSTKTGEWTGGEASRFVTKRLNGLEVGVVGASHVGREVIKLLKPFGCVIRLYDPLISEIDAAALGVARSGLDELVSSCDVVTLHAPAIESCRHMLNKNNLPLLKDGALLINTARGTLIDEAALIAELETGRFFACIDVTEPEPPPADHRFRSLANVILTPHIAGGHTETGRRMLGRNSINEIYNYLHKGVLNFEVRREMLETMA